MHLYMLQMQHMNAGKAPREKAWRQLHKNATSYIEQILDATSHKTAVLISKTHQIRQIRSGTLLEESGQTHK